MDHVVDAVAARRREWRGGDLLGLGTPIEGRGSRIRVVAEQIGGRTPRRVVGISGLVVVERARVGLQPDARGFHADVADEHGVLPEREVAGDQRTGIDAPQEGDAG